LIIVNKVSSFLFAVVITLGIEGSCSSEVMDGAKQGFSIPPCQSCHHALYQLPQMSEEIQNSIFKLTVLFRVETPKRIGVYMT
jgi:hypothetical protein